VDELVDLMDDRRAAMGTLAKRIADVDDITNPNVVKVVFDHEGFALYFSRAPVPFHRDLFAGRDLLVNKPAAAALHMFRHVGLYAHRREALLRFTALPVSVLEEAEKLEQLRALEYGLPIKVGETTYHTVGVDTPEDLLKAERCISSSL
jgi:3-deoxy-manno-octulosonate cytidylyltransferase (CMP-KDO synthetase)